MDDCGKRERLGSIILARPGSNLRYKQPQYRRCIRIKYMLQVPLSVTSPFRKSPQPGRIKGRADQISSAPTLLAARLDSSMDLTSYFTPTRLLRVGTSCTMGDFGVAISPPAFRQSHRMTADIGARFMFYFDT